LRAKRARKRAYLGPFPGLKPENGVFEPKSLSSVTRHCKDPEIAIRRLKIMTRNSEKPMKTGKPGIHDASPPKRNRP